MFHEHFSKFCMYRHRIGSHLGDVYRIRVAGCSQTPCRMQRGQTYLIEVDASGRKNQWLWYVRDYGNWLRNERRYEHRKPSVRSGCPGLRYSLHFARRKCVWPFACWIVSSSIWTKFHFRCAIRSANSIAAGINFVFILLLDFWFATFLHFDFYIHRSPLPLPLISGMIMVMLPFVLKSIWLLLRKNWIKNTSTKTSER